MKNRLLVSTIATVFALGFLNCAAYADDTTFDPRAVAMGGTGVATSSARNAAFRNPSMLASSTRDAFAVEIPIIAVRLQDQNSLKSGIDQLQTSSNNLSFALNAFVNSQSQANATAAVTALTGFNNALIGVSNKSLMADVLGGMMLGIPSKNYAFALYLDRRIELGAMFNYAAADQATINTLSNNLSNCAAGNNSACTAAQNSIGANGQVNGLQSQLFVRGVDIKEVGVTAARHFDSLAGMDIGITPKSMQLTTYDYVLNAQSAQISLNQNQGANSYSAFNLDIGALKTFSGEGDNTIKAGVVVKNMLSKSLQTVLGDTIDIKPQMTVGASYLTNLTTTGVDLDVISNKPVINGFSKESQYLRLGVEFDAWRWAQLRAGYRHDIKGNYKGLTSFGVGLSPFGLHIDLSYAQAGDSEKAFSLQTGFNF